MSNLLEHDPRKVLLIALLVGLTMAAAVTIILVATTTDRTPLSKRLNNACQTHRGITQALDGDNTVICKDGTAVDY